MVRLFQRSNAQKVLDQESSTTGARAASNAVRITDVEDDVANLQTRMSLAELAINDHQTLLLDHEARITDLETP